MQLAEGACLMTSGTDIAETKQLEFVLYPEKLDVDGRMDCGGAVRFLGEAWRENDGQWRAIADVNGALCLVAIKVRGLCKVRRRETAANG